LAHVRTLLRAMVESLLNAAVRERTRASMSVL